MRGPAILLLLLGAIGCTKGTFVTLSLDQKVTAPATVRIDVMLSLDGKSATTTLSASGGKAIGFPTSASLQIGGGSGQMSVIAIATDVSGKEIDRVSGTVAVVAGSDAPLVLTLGGVVVGGGGDLGLGSNDLAGDAGTGAGVPGAPINVVASSGNAQATVTWSAPASSGASAITSYVVRSIPGTSVVTTSDGTTTTATLTGLTNGTSYTFSVAASNAAGTGPTATSNATTPTATPMSPSAPTSVSAIANVDHGATIGWTAADNHGSALIGYTISATQLSGTIGTAGPTATSAQVIGLTPGTQYTFTVTAANGVGSSNASFPSSPITAGSVPGAAPANVTASANIDHGATVKWAALPANSSSDGWSPMTKYTVSASPGTASVSTPDGNTLTAEVTGLTPGTSYTFKVVAENAIGGGPASAASGAISGCVSPSTPEDCFNGIDDNCNGLIDCADTVACPSSAATCVPATGGTYGTLLGGTTLPACPTGTTAQKLYNNLVTNPNDPCTGCSTSAMTGTPSATFFSDTDSTCPGSLQTQNPQAVGGSCASVTFDGDVFTIFDVSGVGCSPPTGTATPRALGTSDITIDEFCSGSAAGGGGCGAGNVCVPNLGANPSCVMLAGNVACSGSYPNATSWNTSYSDGRSCAACSTSSTFALPMWNVYSQPGCSSGLIFTDNTGAAQCGDAPVGTVGSVVWDRAANLCASSLSTTGSVTAAGAQVTVCCH